MKWIKTIRKVKTSLPSLKAPIENALKSGLVYRINCSQCDSCYVGQTTRHLLTRTKEHSKSGTPVGNHFFACGVELTMNDVEIIATPKRSNYQLMTLEALFIDKIKPIINSKDEWKINH